MLFEDILDIEGALRVALAADADFTPSDLEQMKLGIVDLAGRVPDAVLAQLRTLAGDLQAAVAADDAAQVRASQSALVETLTSLRATLA